MQYLFRRLAPPVGHRLGVARCPLVHEPVHVLHRNEGGPEADDADREPDPHTTALVEPRPNIGPAMAETKAPSASGMKKRVRLQPNSSCIGVTKIPSPQEVIPEMKEPLISATEAMTLP